MLTDKYLDGVPDGIRARAGPARCKQRFAQPRTISTASARSNDIAQRRGQTLAQMAIAWVLRDPRVTSALIGARTVEQLDNSLDALKRPTSRAEELTEIDRFASEGGIDLWRSQSRIQPG